MPPVIIFKIAVILSFLATRSDGFPWKTTASTLGSSDDFTPTTTFRMGHIGRVVDNLSASPKPDFENLPRSKSTGKVEEVGSYRSTGLNSDTKSHHSESTDHLHAALTKSNDQKATNGDDYTSTTMYDLENSKVMPDNLPAKLSVSSKPDSGTSSFKLSTNSELTIRPSILNSESKSINNSQNRMISNSTSDESLKNLGLKNAGLRVPNDLKCNSCPDDRRFCCKSGCCGRVSFWLEPPAAYYWMAWIVAIALIVGISIFPFANRRAKTQVLSVVYNDVKAKMKDGCRISASTCETTLTDDRDRADEVFDYESYLEPTYPEPGCNETTDPATENRYSDQVEYEHSLAHPTTDESAFILDSHGDYSEDVRFKF